MVAAWSAGLRLRFTFCPDAFPRNPAIYKHCTPPIEHFRARGHRPNRMAGVSSLAQLLALAPRGPAIPQRTCFIFALIVPPAARLTSEVRPPRCDISLRGRRQRSVGDGAMIGEIFIP